MKSRSPRVIAIDGPAASGKSTVAKKLARRLNFAFVSSGLMYRAFTWVVCRAGIDPDDTDAVRALLDRTDFEISRRGNEMFLTVNGIDPGNDLTDDAVNLAVSHVAKIKEVRTALVRAQRACAENGDVVMEGRDIGSVVFPDTPHKFFLDARQDVRAARRKAQGLADVVGERDRIDSTRQESPLTVAEGAVVLDTSELTLPQVVEALLANLAEQGLPDSIMIDALPSNRVTFIYRLFHRSAGIIGRLLFGFRVVHGERIIHDGPALIVCNHQSFLDPPLISVPFQTPIHFLARKSLFENRWFGGLIRRLNAIPVDQSRPDFTGLKTIITLLKRGERVLLFPEGSRTVDGRIGRAQPGTGFIIAKSGVPVLPMRIFGAFEAWPRGGARLRMCRITLVVGELVDFSASLTSDRKGRDFYQSLADRTLEAISALRLPESS